VVTVPILTIISRLRLGCCASGRSYPKNKGERQ
jgi:hypothetical protein